MSNDFKYFKEHVEDEFDDSLSIEVLNMNIFIEASESDIGTVCLSFNVEQVDELIYKLLSANIILKENMAFYKDRLRDYICEKEENLDVNY